MDILFYFLIIFAGFTIGRIGHIYGGHLRTPHHWIYGFTMAIGGKAIWDNTFGLIIVLFGLGLLVSDFKDFRKLKFDMQPDIVEKKKFWGID